MKQGVEKPQSDTQGQFCCTKTQTEFALAPLRRHKPPKATSRGFIFGRLEHKTKRLATAALKRLILINVATET